MKLTYILVLALISSSAVNAELLRGRELGEESQSTCVDNENCVGGGLSGQAGPNYGTVPPGGWSTHTVVSGGLEWLYASPINPSPNVPGSGNPHSGWGGSNNYPDCLKNSGFRLPTHAEFAHLPGSPPPCMSEYSAALHSHCDTGDYGIGAIYGIPTGPWAPADGSYGCRSTVCETLYVRPVGTADSCIEVPDVEPSCVLWYRRLFVNDAEPAQSYMFQGECHPLDGGEGDHLPVRPRGRNRVSLFSAPNCVGDATVLDECEWHDYHDMTVNPGNFGTCECDGETAVWSGLPDDATHIRCDSDWLVVPIVNGEATTSKPSYECEICSGPSCDWYNELMYALQCNDE